MKKIKSVLASKQFYTILCDRLTDGDFNNGDHLPSIREFARLYGISKTTVSAAIRVLENQGYIEAIQGKGIYATGKIRNNKTIGVLLLNYQEQTGVEFSILKGIQENLKEGYYLSVMDTSNNMKTICRNAKLLVDLGTQGLIVLPPKCPEASEQEMQEFRGIVEGHAFLSFLLRDIPCPNSDFVTVDWGKGVYDTVHRLIRSGRKRILFILHDYEQFADKELISYVKAFQDNQCAYDSKYIIRANSDREELKTAVMSRIPDADAFIASDYLLYYFKDTFSDRLENNDIALAGINNSIYSDSVGHDMIRINFPTYLLGKTAIELLTDRIENHPNSERTVKVLDAEMI